MIIAVFDTNVLASGLAGETRPESTPGVLIRRWRARHFTLVVSEPILTELKRNLTNPFISSRFPSAMVTKIVTRIAAEAHIQDITVSLTGVATHPEDDARLATALSGNIAYLVTGDHQLQQRGVYAGTRLLSPRQFLEILDLEQTT